MLLRSLGLGGAIPRRRDRYCGAHLAILARLPPRSVMRPARCSMTSGVMRGAEAPQIRLARPVAQVVSCAIFGSWPGGADRQPVGGGPSADAVDEWPAEAAGWRPVLPPALPTSGQGRAAAWRPVLPPALPMSGRAGAASRRPVLPTLPAGVQASRQRCLRVARQRPLAGDQPLHQRRSRVARQGQQAGDQSFRHCRRVAQQRPQAGDYSLC